MGLEPSYVFRFKVGELGNPYTQPTKSRRIVDDRGWDKLRWVWQRIWTAAPEIALKKNRASREYATRLSSASSGPEHVEGHSPRPKSADR
jgi:hypothetical protein